MVRLVRFIHGDAPVTGGDPFKWDGTANGLALRTPGTTLLWRVASVVPVAPQDGAGGQFALLRDDGTVDLASITEVIDVFRAPDVGVLSCSPATATVSEQDLENVDFRNTKGKRIEKERQEYGAARNVAAAKPVAMDKNEQIDKLKLRTKRQRDAMQTQIDRTIDAPSAAAGGESSQQQASPKHVSFGSAGATTTATAAAAAVSKPAVAAPTALPARPKKSGAKS